MYFIAKMKTDASSTTKTSKQKRIEKIAAGQALVGFFIDFLEHWSAQQLQDLLSKNPGLCINLNKGHYRVGQFTVVRTKNNLWRVRDKHSDIQGEFYNRASAIFYCLYMGKAMIQSALNIKQQDSTVCKLAIDYEMYQHSKDQAIKRKDWFKADLADTRLQETRVRLNHAQEELKKTLSAAKYNNHFGNKKP